jgi:hypothetical protein
MARERRRPEPTTNTMLVLLKDGRSRVRPVVIGSALLDADWAADLSMLMPESEAPSLCELDRVAAAGLSRKGLTVSGT